MVSDYGERFSREILMSDSKASTRRLVVGVDVGGTFTDLAALDDDGTIVTSKVLSVASDRAQGVLDALDAASIAAPMVSSVAHGTTVVTNLLLERRGARVVACATKGFTDLLELRRQERAALYDLTRHHPLPLVPPDRIIPVLERISPEGVVTALDGVTVGQVVSAVLDLNPDTVAITLLHSYADASHEELLTTALRNEIDRRGVAVDVVASHEVLPEIREYERMATTVAEAYSRPAVRKYLGGLSERLNARGFPSPRVMTSAGGTLPAKSASAHAAALALSGPAGGVTGAAVVARALGISSALTIDIGGTSADVGFISNGEPLVERGSGIGGVPIALPRVLVEAVAAGGGSIAWLDDGGALRVGPESAGATPGPAAYGRGGTSPTLTDAHVVRGSIASGVWSGGVRVSLALAMQAIDTVAQPLGVSPERAASAVIGTADATMARALHRISVERGVDPRGLPLIAFGGGGPLHACGLAERLGVRQIVIPPHAGVLSAVGLALAPERRESIVSCMQTESSWSDDDLRVLLASAARDLAGGDMHLRAQWTLRARYAGQGYELDVSVGSADRVQDAAGRFVAAHFERTGFTLERQVEFISLRTTVSGEPHAISWSGSQNLTSSAAARKSRTEASSPYNATAHSVSGIASRIEGHAVVPLSDSTMLVADGWYAFPLDIGGWMMEHRL